MGALLWKVTIVLDCGSGKAQLCQIILLPVVGQSKMIEDKSHLNAQLLVAQAFKSEQRVEDVKERKEKPYRNSSNFKLILATIIIAHAEQRLQFI